jgi:hypothetical protein
MQAGRIPDDACYSPGNYREIGVDHAHRTRAGSYPIYEVIRTEFPKLAEKMHVLTAVLAWQTRAMEIIDCDTVHRS